MWLILGLVTRIRRLAIINKYHLIKKTFHFDTTSTWQRGKQVSDDLVHRQYTGTEKKNLKMKVESQTDLVTNDQNKHEHPWQSQEEDIKEPRVS